MAKIEDLARLEQDVVNGVPGALAAMARFLTSHGEFAAAAEVWSVASTRPAQQNEPMESIGLEYAKALDRVGDPRADTLYRGLTASVTSYRSPVDIENWDGGPVVAYADYLFRNSGPEEAIEFLERAASQVVSLPQREPADAAEQTKAYFAKKKCEIELTCDYPGDAEVTYMEAQRADRDGTLRERLLSQLAAHDALNTETSRRVRWTSRFLDDYVSEVNAKDLDVEAAREYYAHWRRTGTALKMRLGDRVLQPGEAALTVAKTLADSGTPRRAALLLRFVPTEEAAVLEGDIRRSIGDNDEARGAYERARHLAKDNAKSQEFLAQRIVDLAGVQPLRDIEVESLEVDGPAQSVVGAAGSVESIERPAADMQDLDPPEHAVEAPEIGVPTTEPAAREPATVSDASALVPDEVGGTASTPPLATERGRHAAPEDQSVSVDEASDRGDVSVDGELSSTGAPPGERRDAGKGRLRRAIRRFGGPVRMQVDSAAATAEPSTAKHRYHGDEPPSLLGGVAAGDQRHDDLSTIGDEASSPSHLEDVASEPARDATDKSQGTDIGLDMGGPGGR